MPISPLPSPPNRADPINFAARGDALMSALPVFVDQANALQNDVNAAAAAASTAQSMRDAAQAAANYRGVWASMSGAISIPACVHHQDNFWILVSNLPNIAASEPGRDSAWAPVNGFRTPLPVVRPSLMLDFANSQAVDPRISFYRASSATKINKNGIIVAVPSGIPRIDFDPVTLECKGLLIEETRTNYAPYSNQFDNASWRKTRLAVIPDLAISPDGGQNADWIFENSSTTTDHYLSAGYAGFTSGLTYTFSAFFKPDTRSCVELWIPASIFSDNSIRLASFNLSTGVIATSGTGTSATIVPFGNGWFRCAMTFLVSITTGTDFLIRLHNGAGSFYSGDGSSGLFVWGASVEQGNFVTSYIPTAAAAATRIADAATMTGNNFHSWFHQQVGTLCIGRISSRYPLIAPYDQIDLSDGSVWNRISSRSVGDSANQTMDSGISAGGTVTVDGGNVVVLPNVKNKTALAWSKGESADVVNGGYADIQTPQDIPTVDRLTIGGGGSYWLTNLSYYPARLSNATLQALTAK
jgi:hypothetical protein